MDYSVLLFYISILLIIYGIHSINKQSKEIRKKINIPKIKYTKVPEDSYYTKTFDNIFTTENRLLNRV